MIYSCQRKSFSLWCIQVLVALNQGEDKSAISPDSLFQVLVQFHYDQICAHMLYWSNFTSRLFGKLCQGFEVINNRYKPIFNLIPPLIQFNLSLKILTLCRTLTSFFGTCWTASTLNSCNFSLVQNPTKPGWMNSDPPDQFLTVRCWVSDFIFFKMVCWLMYFILLKLILGSSRA